MGAPLCSVKEAMFCGASSSKTRKSFCVRPVTGVPLESVTITSNRTTRTFDWKVAGACEFDVGAVCEKRRTVRKNGRRRRKLYRINIGLRCPEGKFRSWESCFQVEACKQT